MKRTLKVRVGSVASALDRFEEVWSKAARGEKVPAEHVLTFVNPQLLLRTLTPARHAKKLKAFVARLPKVEHARVGRYKRQGRA